MIPPSDTDGSLGDTQWQTVRAYLREHRPLLTAAAADLYPTHPRVGTSLLLTRPGWMPAHPIPLGAARLEWADDGARPAADLLAAAARLLPGRDDQTLATYADAVKAIERPGHLENRYTYRLVEAQLVSGRPRMRFGGGEYFDVLNIGEAAAHELAQAHQQGSGRSLSELPLRELVGDPTAPGRRRLLTAVTTLTIRYDHGHNEARFLVHWRDPAKVATNAGYYQVVPVGMFQPAGDPSTRHSQDFDLWRCVARELSEELLGAAEHQDVDYERWPFYQALQAARRSGRCRPYLLGAGVDPLTFATDILTTVVFDASAFDELLTGLVEENAEGQTTIDGHDGHVGTLLEPDTVRRLVDDGQMQPAGAATLDLAWRHRAEILRP